MLLLLFLLFLWHFKCTITERFLKYLFVYITMDQWSDCNRMFCVICLGSYKLSRYTYIVTFSSPPPHPPPPPHPLTSEYVLIVPLKCGKKNNKKKNSYNISIIGRNIMGDLHLFIRLYNIVNSNSEISRTVSRWFL